MARWLNLAACWLSPVARWLNLAACWLSPVARWLNPVARWLNLAAQLYRSSQFRVTARRYAAGTGRCPVALRKRGPLGTLHDFE